jgi:hypothetical protein
MTTTGDIALDGDVIGSFITDTDDKIVVMFNRDDATVEEILDFAADNGLTLSLMLTPPFETTDKE